MDRKISTLLVQSFEAYLIDAQFPNVGRRRGGSGKGLAHSLTHCITILVLLLVLVNENPVLGRVKKERHPVVKDSHIDAIPWARGRQSDPGVGRYWRRCHANFLKEVQVGLVIFWLSHFLVCFLFFKN